MPKPIPNLPPLGREILTGDLIVIEAPDGTRKTEASKISKALKKYMYSALGGEKEIAVPLFSDATFSVVFASMQPLDEYLGNAAVPGGYYKADPLQSKIILGDALEPGEKVLILYT